VLSRLPMERSAALVRDGEVIAAAQEERFSRIRHDESFPSNAVRYCLDAGGISVKDIDYFVFYDKPLLKFERLLETYLALAPRGFRSFAKALPVWAHEKLFQDSILREEFSRDRHDDAAVDQSQARRDSSHFNSLFQNVSYMSQP
jgi:carbamoyltransferase